MWNREDCNLSSSIQSKVSEFRGVTDSFCWESLTTSWAERLDKIWVVVKREEITLKERTGVQRLVQRISREVRSVEIISKEY